LSSSSSPARSRRCCGSSPSARELLVALSLVAGCFPNKSNVYECDSNDDCTLDRVCSANKFCIVGDRDPDGGIDAPPDVPPDADPFEAQKTMCITAGYTAVPAANNRLYRRVVTGLPWLNAEADCADDVPGATHLVVISDTVENDLIKTELGWVGLSDRVTEGTFVTVNGELNDFRVWAPGRPDGGNNENCVSMKTTAGLDDNDCPTAQAYTCECDGRAAVP
jgi:hypothetical protein